VNNAGQVATNNQRKNDRIKAAIKPFLNNNCLPATLAIATTVQQAENKSWRE
jgi:hypothetical protein